VSSTAALGFSRGGARRHPRWHSGLRPVRPDAANGAALRRAVWRAEFAGRAGDGGDDQKLVDEARLLEDAGAAALDFTNSGPAAGAAVVAAVAIR